MWMIRCHWSSCHGWGWWCLLWAGGPTRLLTAPCSTLLLTSSLMSKSQKNPYVFGVLKLFWTHFEMFQFKKVIRKFAIPYASLFWPKHLVIIIVTLGVFQYHLVRKTCTVEYELQRKILNITQWKSSFLGQTVNRFCSSRLLCNWCMWPQRDHLWWFIPFHLCEAIVTTITALSLLSCLTSLHSHHSFLQPLLKRFRHSKSDLLSCLWTFKNVTRSL